MDWLDKHSNATATLCHIAFELEGLSNAFQATGNDSMYKTLMWMAKDIHQAAQDAREGMTASIKESIDRSTESSKTILKAALAGALIGKTESTKRS